MEGTERSRGDAGEMDQMDTRGELVYPRVYNKERAQEDKFKLGAGKRTVKKDMKEMEERRRGEKVYDGWVQRDRNMQKEKWWERIGGEKYNKWYEEIREEVPTYLRKGW